MTLLRRLLPDPFIMLLAATVMLATLVPATGWPLSAISWASNAAIVLLFFLHGARLSRQAVLDGAKKWRLLSAIMLFGYAVFPLAMWATAHGLAGRVAPELLAGLIFLGVLPTTVQSSIAYASIARGNVAAAVIASAASNMLAVVATPVLFALIAGSAVAGVSSAGIGKVATLLLLPFALGQMLRGAVRPVVERHAWLAGNIDKMTIVLAVYVAFSQAETEGLWHRIDAGALLALAALMAGVLLGAFAAAWGIGAAMGLERADRATLLFASVHKSLATGAPMARILFPPALAGAAILPLLLYHQMQLMLSAVIAARLAKRAERIT